jgi:hypothetical protein
MLEKHVGGWGRYQWLYLIFFAVTVADLAYVSYSPILYLYVPESHWCSPPPGDRPHYKLFYGYGQLLQTVSFQIVMT